MHPVVNKAIRRKGDRGSAGQFVYSHPCRGILSPRRKLGSAPFWLDYCHMRIRVALLVVLMMSAAPMVPSVAAEKSADRFALVIGNAKYPDAEAPLKEPINDARDIAEELKRDGFNVEIGENLTGDAMHRAFERLYGRIKPGCVALIFFSGFGVQSSRQSYMIP